MNFVSTSVISPRVTNCTNIRNPKDTPPAATTCEYVGRSLAWHSAVLHFLQDQIQFLTRITTGTIPKFVISGGHLHMAQLQLEVHLLLIHKRSLVQDAIYFGLQLGRVPVKLIQCRLV